jgi:hypothetical protein
LGLQIATVVIVSFNKAADVSHTDLDQHQLGRPTDNNNHRLANNRNNVTKSLVPAGAVYRIDWPKKMPTSLSSMT